MKRNTILTTIALVVAAPLASQAEVDPAELAKIGILPDQRKASQIDFRRNPFAVRSKKIETRSTVDNSESQEAKIRRVLAKLEVTGTVGSGSSPKVMLGDIILEQGRLVPQLIQNQTEQLLVDKIDDKKIKIVWIETSPDAPTNRSHTIVMNMDPKVEMPLAGHGGTGAPTVEKGKTELEAEKKLTEILLSRINGSGSFSSHGNGSGSSSGGAGVGDLVKTYDTQAPAATGGPAGRSLDGGAANGAGRPSSAVPARSTGGSR